MEIETIFILLFVVITNVTIVVPHSKKLSTNGIFSPSVSPFTSPGISRKLMFLCFTAWTYTHSPYRLLATTLEVMAANGVDHLSRIQEEVQIIVNDGITAG
jgi:hypothetical protein